MENNQDSKNYCDLAFIDRVNSALNKINACFQNRCACVDTMTLEGVEKLAENLESFKYLVEGEIGYIKKRLALYNAYRDAPRRAKARDDCDEILMKLDSIRDIIVRSIEGDEDVVCTESGARAISDFLKETINILPLLKETVYVLPGKQ